MLTGTQSILSSEISEKRPKSTEAEVSGDRFVASYLLKMNQKSEHGLGVQIIGRKLGDVSVLGFC